MKRRDLLKALFVGGAAVPFRGPPAKEPEAAPACRTCEGVRWIALTGEDAWKMDEAIREAHAFDWGRYAPVTPTTIGMPCPECRHVEFNESIEGLSFEPTDLPHDVFRGWARGHDNQPSPLLELFEELDDG